MHIFRPLIRALRRRRWRMAWNLPELDPMPNLQLLTLSFSAGVQSMVIDLALLQVWELRVCVADLADVVLAKGIVYLVGVLEGVWDLVVFVKERMSRSQGADRANRVGTNV
jgi:hypothetical protein